MQNVRKLLKLSGSLLLIELTKMSLRTFAFGTLPGWWLGKSYFPDPSLFRRLTVLILQ